MKPCFGYIRVSTQKQGEGVSLEAQKDAMSVFASKNDLSITRWFEEKETAAKRGRPVFNQMLRQLKRGGAKGLVMHKIDRSARNLRDWALVSELPNLGIDIFFATESLDFRSRGGRLAANLQAVIAEDYIFNLREECIKGMNGRLKQGLFPWAAPPGYLDQGGGKPKTPCPKTAPLIRELFELYATGRHSYKTLILKMHRRGLRNKRGGRLTLNGLSTILQNPFYIGLIGIKRTGETFEGVHEPIVPVATWTRAQEIRSGRSAPKVTRHNHQFQGVFRCGNCSGPMVPELQKGHVYYRCKLKTCPTKTIREENLDAAILSALKRIQLRSKSATLAARTDESEILDRLRNQRAGLSLQIADEERRLERLEDLLVSEALSLEAFNRRRSASQKLLAELRERHAKIPSPEVACTKKKNLAELQKNLALLYEMAGSMEKRMIVENVWPNRTVFRKEVTFEPYSWVANVGLGEPLPGGEPERDRGRTSIVDSDKLGYENLFPLMKLILGDARKTN